jgi:hypothetical protein
MKNLIRNTAFVLSFVGLSLIALLGLSSCASRTNFLISTVVPAAEGTIRIKKDKNKNYDIVIKMYNLAEVERLEPPKKAYVVWMENEEGRAKNLGQIISSHEFLTKKLRSTFETVSPFKPTKIYITAEDEANVISPSSMIVLLSNPFH